MSMKSKQCKCASCAGAACKCGCQNAKTSGQTKGCNAAGINATALLPAIARSVRCKLWAPRIFVLTPRPRAGTEAMRGVPSDERGAMKTPFADDPIRARCPTTWP